MPEEKQIGITVKKSENFSEWYTQVASLLADYAPVKGFMIIKPDGYALWEKIQEFVNYEIKKRNVKNAYFPLFIPESFLKREAEHFTGFTPEVAWVTMAGKKELDEKLAIRPTSETVMYNTYSKWIRSWRDLPLLINQWCSVVRWETKATKLFLRTREFLWQEGHTVHATKEAAEKETIDILHNVYGELIQEYLAIPVLFGKKPEQDKFAGAVYTAAPEALMPDGKALQMGTTHFLGQKFSKPFEIQFLNEKGEKEYGWQACWGVSTRLIGGLIMVHGDDKGLIIPPKIAPTQIVIIPIYKEKEKNTVLKSARVLKKNLEKNFSVHLDDRGVYTPGWKFHEWEMLGIPLRVEIGPRDIKNLQVILVRRDTGEKKPVKLRVLKKEIKKTLDLIQKNLFEKAKKFLNSHIKIAKDFNELKKAIDTKNIVKTCWCGNEKCADLIKEKTQGADIRLIPFEKEKLFCTCAYCNQKAKHIVYIAKSH